MIEQHYPGATSHIRAAQTLRAELGELWSQLLGNGLVGATIKVDPDGSGVILAEARWPERARQDLTDVFASCVRELWNALDALVVETVEQFAVLQTAGRDTSPRFFPIAPTPELFEDLLDEGCLDGVLRTHFHIVRDCQEFNPPTDIKGLEDLKVGLARLVTWENAINDGALISAWSTPTDPQVWAPSPAELEDFRILEPHDLIEFAPVAEFRFRELVDADAVEGAPGTWVDLGFAPGFEPTDLDDTFDARLRHAINAVINFAAHFSRATSAVAGSRGLLLGSSRDNPSWRDALTSPRAWQPDELAALSTSETGVGVAIDNDPESTTVLIATRDGAFERSIPRASTLRAFDRVGTAAESAVRDAVATWGLPDFVMRSATERKGAGVREVGDGLIVVGNRGAIVQVKGREVASDDVDKERRWLAKNIHEAVRQVNGTHRRLMTAAVELRNGRDRPISIDGKTLDWVGVVVLEHSQVPAETDVPSIETRLATVVLTRRDWEFLFDQLKSTRAVVDYLFRVGHPTARLDEEPQRYYEIARLDSEARPGPLADHLVGQGTRHSTPTLPLAPAGFDDPQSFAHVRRMAEEIAFLHWEQREEDRLDVLAAIDGLPVANRAELGKLLLDELEKAQTIDPKALSWRARTFASPNSGGTQIGFCVLSHRDDHTDDLFQAWIMLRQHERAEREDIHDARFIGVLLTPRPDGYRDWDTTLMVLHGDPGLTPTQVSAYRKFWGSRGSPDFGDTDETT